MCFGTFDLLHLGHLNYFQQAKRHGNYLIVVVARDYTKLHQHKQPLFNEQERLQMIKHINIINKVLLGYPDDHYRIIQEINPDVICLGYDQQVSISKLKTELAHRNVFPKITRLKSYKSKTHKSSLLKHKIHLVLNNSTPPS